MSRFFVLGVSFEKLGASFLCRVGAGMVGFVAWFGVRAI